MNIQHEGNEREPSAIVVGGGLAGVAAAIALAKNGIGVTLIEAKKRLGGRVGSYVDPVSGEWIDYCQHVGMACCTNLWQLIRWLNQDRYWKVQQELHFFGPDGQYQRLSSLPVLPAPFHLAAWLWKWPGLKLHDRWSVARGLRQLDRISIDDETHRQSAAEWLRAHQQTPTALARFWKTIVVSALGEELDRVSLAAVAKVFQDGFLRHRDAFHLLVPQLPLSELFGQLATERLRELGVVVRFGGVVQGFVRNSTTCNGVVLSNGERLLADHTIVAVPWHRFAALLEGDSAQGEQDPLRGIAQRASKLTSSPISGVHTWWDRPWLNTPHAVLIDRFCQWVFPEPGTLAIPNTHEVGLKRNDSVEHYYQIVISASRQLPTDRSSLPQLIQSDLANVFPKVAAARLVRHKLITDPQAVFSVDIEAQALRPSTSILDGSLLMAGDWIRTGWPSTMESAVLSGFLAAEKILNANNIRIPIQAEPLVPCRSKSPVAC